MKYAILSDVHANPAALKNVLSDARKLGAEKILCLGDVVGYGPEAEDTVRLVREEVDVALMGNHDAAVSAVITGAGFSLYALRGVKRHRDETSVESKQWLSRLPYTFQGDDFACAHGEFSKPEAFEYVTAPEDALPSFESRNEDVLFVGHTHAASVLQFREGDIPVALSLGAQIQLDEGCRYLVNVGSVGYPRYDVDSIYCLYDTSERTLTFRRLQFDFKGYEKKMRKRDVDMPRWFEELKARNYKR